MEKKQNTKKRSTGSKAFYIAFSVIASIALWMYVAYNDNSVKDVPIYGIPVEVTGKELLADNNLIVTDISTGSVSARFSGKRNTLAKLSSSNITAVLDLTSILKSGTSGEYQLSYTLTFANNATQNAVHVVSMSDDYISVTVEKMLTVELPVEGVYNGGVKDGYTAEKLTVSPETVNVTGPQSVVSEAASVYAELVRKDLSETVTETVAFSLLDKDGKVIKNDNLTFSTDMVTITQPVLMVKEIPLTVNLVESNSATEENTVCDIYPKTVTVSGDPNVLSEINSILLGTIDLTDFASSMAYTFPIALPDGTNNISGEATASVELEIAGMTTRRLSASSIKTKNEPSGYNVSVITQSLDIMLRGKESELNSVLPENVRIVADLGELQNVTGTFSVDASVFVDGNNSIDAIGDYKITVTISKR